MQNNFLKNHGFSLILFISIILGGLTGHFLGTKAHYLKPFGEIFLNLILTSIVPLVFFSVSSAVARAGKMGKLKKIIIAMLVVFLVTGIIAALVSLIVVKIIPPAEGVHISLKAAQSAQHPDFLSKISSIFTVSSFAGLLSHENMLALIIFSILVGMATIPARDNGKAFSDFLQAGETVFMQVFSFIMYYAPIGFFAYFAVLVSELGPELMENYLRIFFIYYIFGLIYFFLVYGIYALLAGKIRPFFQNILLPAATAIATCSSAATIPVNLTATQKMGVPKSLSEVIIPLGTVIHKDGSIIGGIFKIAFLFGLFQLDFSGISVLFTALCVSLLVGTVMGAIPGGGLLGELLILNVYGFPPSVLIAVAAISIIIDPLATMLNATGNTAATLLIARFVQIDEHNE